jgi:hypothetical protein
MEFRLLAGEWNHPHYPGPLAGVSVSGANVLFQLQRSSGGPSTAQVVLISLALSVAIFLLFLLLLETIVLIVLFLPPLALALLKTFGLGPRVATQTIAVPLANVRNVGGGGNLVAFGLDLPEASREVAVLLHLLDEAEAERLRNELHSG